MHWSTPDKPYQKDGQDEHSRKVAISPLFLLWSTIRASERTYPETIQEHPSCWCRRTSIDGRDFSFLLRCSELPDPARHRPLLADMPLPTSLSHRNASRHLQLQSLHYCILTSKSIGGALFAAACSSASISSPVDRSTTRYRDSRMNSTVRRGTSPSCSAAAKSLICRPGDLVQSIRSSRRSGQARRALLRLSILSSESQKLSVKLIRSMRGHLPADSPPRTKSFNPS